VEVARPSSSLKHAWLYKEVLLTGEDWTYDPNHGECSPSATHITIEK
jgi:hypothetical protein